MSVLVSLIDRRNAKRKITASFGEQVFVSRKNQGLSQERLALEAGCSQSFLSRVEGGTVKVEPDLAIRIARALNKPELLEAYPVVQAYLEMQFDPRPSGPAAAIAA